MEQLKEKLSLERRRVQQAVREKLVASILAALGLVVGLAWNDAIKSSIEAIFPLGSGGIWAKFIYAVILTIIIAIIIYAISRFFEKKEMENK